MKSTIATNLYRLSLLLIFVIYLASNIAMFIYPKDTDGGGVAATFIVVPFILAVVIILRCTALYMKEKVKWWDFLALIATILAMDFFRFGDSFAGLAVSAIPGFVAVFLLIRTFRSPAIPVN